MKNIISLADNFFDVAVNIYVYARNYFVKIHHVGGPVLFLFRHGLSHDFDKYYVKNYETIVY